MKISLCLITWDNLQGCQADVPKLPRDEFFEIFAVDGGSIDGSIEYLESQGIPTHRQPKRGLNAAYVYANEISTGDAVVVFFPKGTLPTNDLRKFRAFFESGNELVIASRQLPGSVNEEDKYIWRPRKWSVLGLAVVSAIVWHRNGPWVRDVLHGFKGWNRSAFARMRVLDVGLSVDIEMVVRAYKLGISRIEFPTIESPRIYGETKFKLWPTGMCLLKYLWFELHRRE